MPPEKALDLLNQIRLQFEAKGVDHDLAREAYLVLKKYLEEVKGAHD